MYLYLPPTIFVHAYLLVGDLQLKKKGGIVSLSRNLGKIPLVHHVSSRGGGPTIIFDKIIHGKLYTGCCVNGTAFSRGVKIITSRYVTRYI